jgi:hypothetical protein
MRSSRVIVTWSCKIFALPESFIGDSIIVHKSQICGPFLRTKHAMIRNTPLFIISMLVVLLFGITATLSPCHLIKLLARWNKYVFPKIFRSRYEYSDVSNIIELLENEPSRFKKKYSKQLLVIRLSGIMAIIMFSFTMLLLLVSMIVSSP